MYLDFANVTSFVSLATIIRIFILQISMSLYFTSLMMDFFVACSNVIYFQFFCMLRNKYLDVHSTSNLSVLNFRTSL